MYARERIYSPNSVRLVLSLEVFKLILVHSPVPSVGKNPWSLEKTRGIPCGIPITGSRGRSRGIKREQFIVRKNERNRGGSHEARRNYMNYLIMYIFPILASR